MKDFDGRKRQFVIRDRKDDNYDDPAVSRRGFMKGGRAETEEADETPRAPKARKSLREREMEEAEAARRSVPRGHSRKRYDDDFEEQEEEHEGPSSKAPKVVRIFAWIALMAILFAGGYLAANYFFSWSDKKGGERIGSVYGSGSEVKEAEKGESATAVTGVKYAIFVPDGDLFKSREIEITRGNTREEDISKVISMYVDSLKEMKLLEPAVAAQGLYQSGDWLYVDMPPAFQSSLKGIGKAKAQQALNGFVKTISANFPPISKIKFYVNSKEIQDKNPVDLTKPWEGQK